MKIDQKILADFLRRIRIDGDTPLNEFILEGTPEGLQTSGFVDGQFVYVKALLRKETFEDFDPTIKIPVVNSAKLLSYINRFQGPITLNVKENRLIIKSGSNSAEMILASESFIDVKKEPTIEFDAGFKIDSKILIEATKDKETLGATGLNFAVKENTLTLNVGDEKTDRFTRTVPAEFKNATSSYGAGVKSVFNNLDGEVEISFNDNYPMKILKETKDYMVKYILAPLAEETK